MRADVSDVLAVGDLVTVSDGLYAGMDGEVVEIVHTLVPWVGRVRLKLPEVRGEYWHPFWSDPMDESEWLTSRDTSALERYLVQIESPSDSRRWRQFACACARRVLHRLSDQRFHRAVEVGERFAEGLVPLSELRRASERADELLRASRWGSTKAQAAAHAACLATLPELVFPGGARNWALRAADRLDEADAQRDILRDIFGNPFRHAVIDPSWLAWQNGLILSLARHIHHERRFDELPVLGDALEDAGCTDQVVLAHCRGGVHTRGCWLLDAILGHS